ncbi:MAG: fadR 3 [Ilumatobacteraceae bacterium]|nr:fadR 3 [Ilumatobacteraceae bacterium]
MVDETNQGEANQADRHHTDQGNERKQQLLRAAEDLFAAHGYARTRIADICAAAGVAKGLFYWYFPTKESLFAELVRSMRQRLRRAQAAAMDAGADPLTRIRQGTVASVRFMAEHRSYFALLDVERSDHAVASLLREGSDVYAEDVIRLVTEAQAHGLVTDGEPRLHAVGVMGAVSSFSHAWRNGVLDVDIEELAVAVGDWVIGGLSAPTAATRSPANGAERAASGPA